MINFVETKKNYIMALAVLFVIVSLSGTTYSLFLKSDVTNTFNYNTGNLDLAFTEDKPIKLENAFPVNDSEGVNTTSYNLKIKNTGSLTYLFDLKMLSDTEENSINSKYIKVKVNNNLPHTLYQTNNIIATNVIIYPGEELSFKINIWLDNNTPNIELGKTFNAKVVTSGSAIYKTLDASGANHPSLKDDMIPVYYDEESNTWRKADNSNTVSKYRWYNYEASIWANSVTIKNNEKYIYDITNQHHIKINNINYNNENIIIENNYLDTGLKYQNNQISSIIRVKINDLTKDKIYFLSNGKMSYYYDNQNHKFIFKVNQNIASSSVYNLESDKTYIIGYTYDGNKVNFYLNGLKLQTATITGNINSQASIKFGTNETFEDISNITIGDIYLYSDILSDSEINTNYKTSINIIYDNLVCGYNNFIPMTKKEYYQSLSIGSIIKNEDIAMTYVWIPRFKYKLWNVTGENNIDAYDAYNKGIDIVFEKSTTSSGVIYCKNNNCYSDELLITKVTKNDNLKYYTHPAFTTIDGPVTGLWVSKYEISTNSNTCNKDTTTGCLTTDLPIESKKGNYIWTNNYLSNYYQAIKKLGTNNYHLIKNTEWGAITYLSHSKYGVCKNNKCSEINPNNTYISGNNPQDTTTANPTGVYDMAGGAAEFTMANKADQNNALNLNNTHFKSIPISNNDYDLYYDNTFILGDATKELSLDKNIWSNGKNTFIDNTNNWFIRGGIANQNNSTIYNYAATSDINNEYITTRIVIK